MKKLKDAIINLKVGAVLNISKYNQTNGKSKYCSCLMLFDGRVFKDVKEVNLGDFLSMIPNIQNELDNGYIYKVNYLFEQQKYQSTIIKRIRKGGYKEPQIEEIVDNYQVLSDSFIDSIIKLDTTIAQTNSKKNELVKIKVMA